VNLIGEHIDYNGGHVFPCALTLGTYAAVRKRDDRKLRFFSVSFPEAGVIESSLDDLIYKKEDNWANYVKGVIWAFEEHGFKADCGFDFVCVGTIPNKSGLSSSASLEVLTGQSAVGCTFMPEGMTAEERQIVQQVAHRAATQRP
jgi:galactokinase